MKQSHKRSIERLQQKSLLEIDQTMNDQVDGKQKSKIERKIRERERENVILKYPFYYLKNSCNTY